MWGYPVYDGVLPRIIGMGVKPVKDTRTSNERVQIASEFRVSCAELCYSRKYVSAIV